jgi:hypothetical protein
MMVFVGTGDCVHKEWIVGASEQPIQVRGREPKRRYRTVEGKRRIVEAACRAHVRRKVFDLHVAHNSPVVAEVLRRIADSMPLKRTFAVSNLKGVAGYAARAAGCCSRR